MPRNVTVYCLNLLLSIRAVHRAACSAVHSVIDTADCWFIMFHFCSCIGLMLMTCRGTVQGIVQLVVRSAVGSVQCTVYSVQCAVCSGQCTVCSVQCAVCSVYL